MKIEVDVADHICQDECQITAGDRLRAERWGITPQQSHSISRDNIAILMEVLNFPH